MEPTQPPTWQELIPPFSAYLTAGKKSPRTVELRLYQLRRLRQATGLEPSSITSQHLIDMLANPNWMPNTAATARASYASFFRWACGLGHLPADPALMLPSVKVVPGEPKAASDDAVADALAKAPPRTALMVKIGVLAGLRAMEIAQLHSRDVHVTVVRTKKGKKRRKAHLQITGKGAKTRIVPITLELAQEILDRDGYVFPGRIDGHVSPAYVSKLVSRVLPPGVTCHKLRHRFATRAYQNSGNNIRALQKLLGHSSVATTQIYTHVSDEELWDVALGAA
jgi:integrase